MGTVWDRCRAVGRSTVSQRDHRSQFTQPPNRLGLKRHRVASL
jgi:hypothetical protein